jgi:hypothetical protein
VYVATSNRKLISMTHGDTSLLPTGTLIFFTLMIASVSFLSFSSFLVRKLKVRVDDSILVTEPFASHLTQSHVGKGTGRVA